MNEISRILDKSIESFLLALEIYNKPTIQYRLEAFSIFICNAWELMLKAHLLNIGESIYFPDKPDRTISLDDCIKKVFSNDKDPTRKNLERIVSLRNTSTHFIVTELEPLYFPYVQSNVLNYCKKIKQYHNINPLSFLPNHFLVLRTSESDISNESIIEKYAPEVAMSILKKIESISEELSDQTNPNLAIKIDHRFYITKDLELATNQVSLDPKSPEKVKIIRDQKDPNQTHPLQMGKCIEFINKRLSSEKVGMTFNRYHFQLLSKYFNFKSSEKYTYEYKASKTPQYSYSHSLVDFIVTELIKDKKLLDKVRDSFKTKS